MDRSLLSNFWKDFTNWSEARKIEIIDWWTNLEGRIRLGFWIIFIILIGLIIIRISYKILKCIQLLRKGIVKTKRIIKKRKTIKKYRKH
ncbi:alpha 1 protein [Berrimah virus]|uniref:Alpha 1 protein n=1 Tax=Berrimah virus TaxID=318834 RepID=I3NUX9_9RHAB|nr:alpha 1 protein [Berrimah virus]AEH58021.1 alpha 1 protein [Berrimah virus]